MSAKIISRWDYDPDAELTCPRCGWRGTGRANQEYFRELFHVECPQCELMLLIVPYPTVAETREAAAAGKSGAVAALPEYERWEERCRVAGATELKSADQLPELPGDVIEVEWHLVADEDERWVVLRCGSIEVWRELAYFGGQHRFDAIRELLAERYGDRFKRLFVREPGAMVYLAGD